ncbi:hypothetical protein CAPTEDRAFT_20475 [Capitella teleta]|uniref:Uncharacterized protein n=1 Tax=Capitella teleta TaxID=283909 RepID=R7UQ82_CAPTE|nr:hypothetical protein CAPTEDRAFT_20475 [Capitella teleta]|eukprot:ELU05551.1 hypothetical protein CAPTEDRAFT_20475 [Capitella teleta]
MPELSKADGEYFLMQYYENRLQTFVNWPFEDGCICTAEQMAAAGFFYTPESNNPDLVQCFFCCKELDGWDPNDDPWEEHKAHSDKCPYLKLRKPTEDMTLQDQLKLLQAKHLFSLKESIRKKQEQLHEYTDRARSQMLALM